MPTAMLRAFGILLASQLAGETIARAVALPMPGPVIGLVMLVMLVFAVERRHLVDSTTVDGTWLGKVSNGLLAMLGIRSYRWALVSSRIFTCSVSMARLWRSPWSSPPC
jgi:putative effector of murein hydrolase LrgA (UPF0299 family)